MLSFVCYSNGQSFGKHHIVTSGSFFGSVESIAIGDFNNDDAPDIVASAWLGDNISLLINKGNQEFEVLQKLDLNFEDLHQVGTGDINNDGLDDIVYSYYGYFNQLSWLKNTGNNTFIGGGGIFGISGGWETVSFSVIDLNGDNADDIIIACNLQNFALEVKLNSGYGTFTNHTSLIDNGKLAAYQSIDIDNDDDIDIIYSSKFPYRLIVNLNNGNGEFTEKITIDSNAQKPVYSFHSFDSDTDGDNDIIGFTGGDSIPLFLNNGDNGFVKIKIPNNPYFRISGVSSLDFDNDGDLDLINSYAEVLENLGNNTFQFINNENFPHVLAHYRQTDLNNNGDEDIVYASRSGSIGYIEDVSFENLLNWRILTSQVFKPAYPPAYQKINNDEFPDICVLDDNYKYVFFLNNGSGEFPDTIAAEKLHSYSNESAFFDMNQDGFSDIISYSDHEDDSSDFQLARNNGDNSFTHIYIDEFNHLRGRHHAYFSDYDNDNVLNAILTAYNPEPGTDTIHIFKINPDFTISAFDTVTFDVPVAIYHLKFYDVNNDGMNDLMIHDDHSVYVSYSVNGHFSNNLDTLVYSPDRIYDFSPAQIHDDLFTDLVFLTDFKLTVLERFDNSFGQVYHFELTDFGKIIYAQDITGDGIDEVFYLANDKLVMLINIGYNGYEIEEYFYSNKPVYYVNASPFLFTDIDMDGDVDLLATYHVESDISWFENYQIVTSVRKTQTGQFFSVYPNPALKQINIELEAKPLTDFDVLIYDNFGRLINRYSGEKYRTQQSFVIEGFKPGIYYLVLNIDKRFYSSKLIIMK